MDSDRDHFFYSLIAVTIVLTCVLAGCRRSSEKTTSPLPAPVSVSPSSTSPLPSPASSSTTSPWPAGRVLYHSDQTGVYQIYLVVDGQLAVPLTEAPLGAVEPSWSPDGRRIAFAVHTSESGAEVYTMQDDGSDKHRVMTEQPRLNWHPEWSPDGTQLLFQSNRDGNLEIYKVNTDGTSLVNLTNHPDHDYDAAWSPDGCRIAFVSERKGGGRGGLYIMAEDGSDVTRVLDKSWDCSFPRWSPDGKQIAFASRKDGTLDIYLMNADGSDVQQVTERVGDNIMSAWVGNDRLIFSGDMGDLSWDLFLINVDGSDLVQLTTTSESERYPAWTP